MNRDFIDHATRDETLPMIDKYAYLLMAFVCDWRDDVPHSGRQMARWAGMDERSWRRACDRLRETNWIRESPTDGVKWNLRCSCVLCKHATFPVYNPDPVVDEGAAPPPEIGQIRAFLTECQSRKGYAL